MEVVEKAGELLRRYPLCDHCLGRQFSMLGHGLTNGERGKAIKLVLVLEGSRLILEREEAGIALLRAVAVNGFSELSSKTLQELGVDVKSRGEQCHLCGGAFDRLDELAEGLVERLSHYEFDSFLVGVRTGVRVEEREDELRARFKIIWGESIRSDFSREIGRRIMEATGKKVSFKRPDILLTVNPFTKKVLLKANPLCIYGMYRKLVRGIPQARWVCSRCRGHGCEGCNWTGKLYPESVEELISRPLLEATGGSDSKIHAAGREDIDARVLGSGRPFIIEVLNPIRRRIDLKHLEEEINRSSKGMIEVEDLEFTSRDAVRKLKSAEGAKKVYRALVEFEEDISDEALSDLERLMENAVINQRTPARVMHRRAMKLRRRRVYSLRMRRLEPNLVEMILTCDGGLYIKEFINGDGGRTTPSVAEVARIKARCVELDVLKICLEGFN